ncbi:hypothetical protein Q8A67_014453 [Cirrhinus molitorella]|nr:hypothetical protein Q8A67_014453 [Cirrhinus molitorella]
MKEQTEQFIQLRGENDELFTGAKNSATVGWRPSICPPVLIASIPMDTPGPSAAVSDQEEREEEERERDSQPAVKRRRRDSDQELLDLIREAAERG